MTRKGLAKKIAALTVASAMAVTAMPFNVFAYGETDVSTSTFKEDTDNSEAFKTWKANVWEGGEAQYADSGKIALTPGKTDKDLNFAWYSVTKGTPAIQVWKEGAKSQAKVYEGTASSITAENWQGSVYGAANKVSIEGYFEDNTEYVYQYTDNYTGSTTVWSAEYSYKKNSSESFSVILTGDPQVGASGSSSDEVASDASVARDTYNWNLTMTQALKTCPNAAFLLSAGDQIDKSGATSDKNKKTRESEYAGYLYPSVFRSLPIASTIGNHDMAGVDYSNHFNNPNSEDGLGATAAGSDYYFSYGNVLFISLNSNNRNQEEHRALLKKAVESNSDATWKVVIFHSDIYGSGQPHADTDAATNRIIFAPLMDEFDIDLCLTGHDHTYSRSYQILDGNVIDYDISSGSVTDPEGTLYVSTGSGSGSKYYNLLNYTPYYIADRTNACLPAFSTIDFSENALTIKTYDYTGAKYADDFTINKTSELISVDEAIEKADEILSGSDIKNYTAESVSKLTTARDTLKTLKESYTTAPDLMIAEITTKYNTPDDRISGYGSIKNSEDKDVLVSGSVANRLKAGESTLIDKTIYTQIKGGEVIANAVFPIVDATTLEAAKKQVLTAIDGLEKPAEEIVKPSDNNSQGNTENTAPKTGDAANVWILAALMTFAAAVLAATLRKKEENCEE